LIALGLGLLVVAAGLAAVDRHTPFLLLAVLFAVFGGLGESLYAVGVAHANDRAVVTDYVALSSTLLFVWSIGAAIGPTTGTYLIQLTTPSAFFIYVSLLTAAFTLFSIRRLRQRKLDPTVESREEFLVYPQTSPEIYEWLPYHRDAAAKHADGTPPDATQAPTPGAKPGNGGDPASH
jgi:MFS family permease